MAEPPPLFVSYRREDAAGHARALALALNPVFGAERIFIDADDMRPGENFETRLGAAVRAAQVVLVLIGPRWRGEREGAPPRLFDADDFVRQEVATGLAQARSTGRPVVLPLLLDGTPMPAAVQLPPELQELPQRHALPLTHLQHEADIARLVQALQAWVPPARTVARAQRRPWLLAGAGLALATAAGVGLSWRAAAQRQQAAAVAARQRVNGLWTAEVPYPWLRAPRTERLSFEGIGDELRGTVSFLGVDRPLQEGRYSAEQGLRFVTLSREVLGSTERELRHHYRGQPQGEAIAFEMQTEGGHAPQPPLRFIARPVRP